MMPTSQEIQDGRANGACTSGDGSQKQAEGQVETSLQKVKEPTQQAQQQAGASKFIGDGKRFQHGWDW